MGYLLDTMKSRMLDKNWYLNPGKALRCEGDSAQSVVFASIPSLHSTPYDKTAVEKAPEEISSERTLGEAFGSSLSTDPSEQSSGRFAIGRGPDQHEFWVRQTWILVTDRCQCFLHIPLLHKRSWFTCKATRRLITRHCVLGIFTYGSFPRELLQGQAIEILDETLLDKGSSGGLQVIDEDCRLFYIPAANLKSFFVRICRSTTEWTRNFTYKPPGTQDGHHRPPAAS